MADADGDEEMAEAPQQQEVVPLQELVYAGGVFTSPSQGAGAPVPYTIGLKDMLNGGITSCSLRSVVCTAYSGASWASQDAHYLRGQIAALREAGAISMANSGDVDVSVVLGATVWTSNVVNDRYLLPRLAGDNFGPYGDGRTTPHMTVYRAAACADGGVQHSKVSILEFDGDLLRVVVATASPNNNFLSSGNFFVPFDFRPRPIDDDGQSSYPFGEKLVRFFGAVCKKNDQDQDSTPFLLVKSFVQRMYVVDAPGSYLLMNAPHVAGVSLPAPAGAGGERIQHGAFGIHMLDELREAVAKHCGPFDGTWGGSHLLMMSASLPPTAERTVSLLCAISEACSPDAAAHVPVSFFAISKDDAVAWDLPTGDNRLYSQENLQRESLDALHRKGWLRKFEKKDDHPAYKREWHGNFIARANDRGRGWIFITSARLTDPAWRGKNAELGVLLVDVNVQDYLPCDILRPEKLKPSDVWVGVR